MAPTLRRSMLRINFRSRQGLIGLLRPEKALEGLIRFLGLFIRGPQGFREGLYGLERPIRPSKDFTQALEGLKDLTQALEGRLQ